MADPGYRQPWADVWVTFSGKPGRRRYEFAPTLLSRPELDLDLSNAKDEANSSSEYSGHIARLEKIVAVLRSQRVYVDPAYPNPYYPNVYTAAPWIDRSEAEAMLAYFLRALGIPRVKFAWQKQQGPLITPASFAPAADAQQAAELSHAAERAQREIVFDP